MHDFLPIFCLFGLPILLVTALFILNPAANSEERRRSIADRIAWTLFALGVCLMLTMVLYVMTQESEGSWRTWETIRLHSRVFLTISMIPILGPLIVYLIQPGSERRRPDASRKPPVDDWGVEPPLG
jgi:hypothetical protein